MRIVFNVSRRQSGKTERLIHRAKELLINKKRVLFILPTENAVNTAETNSNLKGHIFDITLTTPSLCSQIQKEDYDVFLLDEYLFYPNGVQSYLNRYLRDKNIEVFIETTSKYLLNKKLFDLCVYLRSHKLPSYTMNFVDSQLNREFEYLYNNLLTHPDTSLCVNYDYMRHLHYGSATGKFETEYIGKLFEEEYNDKKSNL